MKVKNRDDIEVFCKYCELAAPLSSDNMMLCRKHGVVRSDYCCRKFSYDPLKRAPRIKPNRSSELEFPEP